MSFHPKLLLPFCLFAIASCDIINPEEQIPNYVYVSDYGFESDSAAQGTNRQQIYDIWFYLNDANVGVFTLPATCPIIKNGDGTDIKMYAGIKDNATSTTRVAYPFFTPVQYNIDFKPNSTDTFNRNNLVFKYKSFVQFNYLEDFEDESVAIVPVYEDINNYTVNHTPSIVFEGKGCLETKIDPSTDIFAVKTYKVFSKNDYRLGSPLYLEMHYKTDGVLQIGLVQTTVENFTYVLDPFLFLRPADSWKKVYINLGDQVGSMTNDDLFSVYFASVLSDSTSTQHFYFDNIKVVSFE